MKAITLWQPWAGFVAAGMKRMETRSWPTGHRGEVAIHASMREMTGAEWERYRDFLQLVDGDLVNARGAIIAVVDGRNMLDAAQAEQVVRSLSARKGGV